MSFVKNVNRASSKIEKEICTGLETKADPFQTLAYSNVLKEKGITKTEFVKILTTIQEGERSKLGQEFHDSIGPMLSLAKLYLEILPTVTTKEKMAKEQIYSCIQTAIDQVRSISADLVVSECPNKTIVQLIDQLSNRVNGTDRLKIFFRHCCETHLKLCPNGKLVLYRIVQEQINNIIKHSKAKSVQISLNVKKNILNLTIKDDGIGFDVNQKAGGIGFANMQARVKQLAGSMQIKSAPKMGCVLNILIPLSCN